jgi:hypothetical protein
LMDMACHLRPLLTVAGLEGALEGRPRLDRVIRSVLLVEGSGWHDQAIEGCP